MDFLSALLLLCTTLCVTSATWYDPTSYYLPGDVVIGGMFPVHQKVQITDNYDLLSKPTVPECAEFFFRGFRWLKSFMFAIEEINNSSVLLPGVNLGWKIFDTCDTTSRSVAQALHIVRDNGGNATKGDVGVVVGPTSSDNSIAVANILGIYDLPQISYGSTTITLSDKNNFNSFLRTIPNDDEQATAIADLLEYYKWSWVGAIGSDDEYGRQGLDKFKREADQRSICIEFEEYLGRNMAASEMDELADRIRDFNATVFVLFVGGSQLKQLATKLKEKEIHGKIWVASEAWATSRSVLSEGGAAMHGTLGIATRGGVMKGFRRYLESVSPFSQTANPFIAEFWEETFNCTCSSDICLKSERNRTKGQIERAASRPPCTGKELVSDVTDNAYLQWTNSELEKSYTAYLAVYTVAYALENIIKCTEGKGLLKDGKCPDIKTLEPWQLLTYLKNAKFMAPGLDEKFGFDANGDPNATYRLVSWVPVPNSTDVEDVEFVHVGNYSKEKYQRWSINPDAIYWRHDNGTQVSKVPQSICSMPCGPGFYRVKLASDCCHTCIPCPTGEYSNATNADLCDKCDNIEMASVDRTYCVPKPEDYIRWYDIYGITFTCLSGLGVIITLFTAGVFFRHRKSAIVKATNVEISFLLFLSLVCSFLTPLIYIAKPEDWSCKARQISFILSFTFCVASILVKTLRVLTAFKATMPLSSRKRSRWLGEHLQILVVILVALVQIVICVIWLVIAPPQVTLDISPFDRILVICDPGSLALTICAAGYLGILAVVAFVFAFRARKLPENFNEAKFITFSMLIVFIVWMSFIPAYLSTTGVMATAVHCIGILASTFGILGCIFFPKLYIILFTPENNTTERVRMTTVNHAFQSAARSVIYRITSDRKNSVTTTLGTSRESEAASSPALRVKTSSPSPCAARARKNRNADEASGRRTSSGDIRTGTTRKAKEYSIEINGKMTSSISPVRKSSGEPKVQSSFGVKLQVNIEADQNSSVESLSSATPKSEDPSEEDDQSNNRVHRRRKRRKAYQRVPQTDSSKSEEVEDDGSNEANPEELVDKKRRLGQCGHSRLPHARSSSA